MISDIIFYSLAVAWSIWVLFVVFPILFAPNYNKMWTNWQKTPFYNQFTGVFITVATTVALIMLPFAQPELSLAMKCALVPPCIVTLSFFVIYIRSRFKPSEENNKA